MKHGKRLSFLRSNPSLVIRISILFVLVILLVLALSGYAFYQILQASVEEAVGHNSLQYSLFLAHLPSIQKALKDGPTENDLQAIYERYLQETDNYIFVVLIDMEGIRYTHPNRSLLGQHITGGDIARSLQGEAYVSKATGVSGTTVRTFVPVFDPESGEQIGAISVGVLEKTLLGIIKEYMSPVLLWLAVALLIGIAASIMLARKIKEILHGFEPDEIAKLFLEKEAILESLSEGLIAVDPDHSITLVNRAARRLLNLRGNLYGQKIEEVLPGHLFGQLMDRDEPEENVEVFTPNMSLLASSFPIRENGKNMGTIITLQDITQVRRLAEELTGVEQYIDGLRAKSHEFMNKLQTLSGLIDLQKYDEVKRFISSTTSQEQELLHFINRNIKDPKISGLILSKFQQADEQNIAITFTPGSRINPLPAEISSDSIVLILGNLIQNAIEALRGRKDGEIQITLLDKEDELVLAVEDNGPGIPEELGHRIFEKGVSTKNRDGNEVKGYGLYLVKNHVENKLGGEIQMDSSPEEGTSIVVIIPKKRRNNHSSDRRD
jgi:sensor histidine kinase regulating citrate/malate metabolism